MNKVDTGYPVASVDLGRRRSSRGVLKWLGIVALAIVACGAGYRYLTASHPAAPQRIAHVAGAPVHIAKPEIKDVPVVVRTIGSVLANATVQVKSQVDGALLAASFQEGHMVKLGDLLFRIDPQPFEASLRQAQAALAKDVAQASSALSESDRTTSLAERGIVSTQQREQATAASDALAASVAADRANVEKAELQLAYTQIRSPIDGKTGPILVQPGNLVKANDTGALVVIAQLQPIKLSFALPQSDIPLLQDRIQAGDLEAMVAIRGDDSTPSVVLDNHELAVKVDFISNIIDARTGTIELRGTSDNPDFRLVPGGLVDVRVRLNTLHNVVTVPPAAINPGPNGDYVYVVNVDNNAEMRPVKVAYSDETIAALAQGLNGDERVIVEGQLRVTPGSPVSILKNPQTDSSASESKTKREEKQAQQ